MPERYVEAILKFLANQDYSPLKPRQLARQMGIAADEYGQFREAVKRLHDAGRIVLGARDALMLPEIGSRVVGFYRPNPKGFGFVTPETPNAHGDLFIPAGSDGGAMTGDLVVATVRPRGKRRGRMLYDGRITKILERTQNRFVGTLHQAEGTWFVVPDGSKFVQPIVVRDVGAAGPKAGSKVVVEIVRYAEAGDLPAGVLVETLGATGEVEAETLAVIRAHGIVDEFSAEALADARAAVAAFDPNRAAGREDLTRRTIVTIDPPDARDYDDAISVDAGRDGTVTLGVHIADVSHFVREGGALDADARRRGTSVYFPRKVVPMLPEVLSNGACSLQEGQRRFCQSAFIRYDRGANVVDARFAQTVIRSSQRLTYRQAQDICDGKTGACDRKVVTLLRRARDLARAIEARRRKAGMLHLDLPEVELVFDDDARVVDAAPADDAYTHTLIEMFMVEANEAAARLLDRLDRPCLRRIHPPPDPAAANQLGPFLRACGLKVPAGLERRDLQALLDGVRGRPESYAVNLAVLRTFQQAEYSPRRIGHFALASSHYCHFTSPIRRYPDLTVHRLIAEHCRGTLASRPPEDVPELVRLGEDLSAGERRAEAAEEDLREVLVLQHLARRVGETFEGVITGVANFGIFVQSPRFLVEGLLRLEDLGDDWWEVSVRYGMVRGERSGRRLRIGNLIAVTIAGVDVARRRLNLVPARQDAKRPGPAGKPKAQPKAKVKPKRSRRAAKRRKA